MLIIRYLLTLLFNLPVCLAFVLSSCFISGTSHADSHIVKSTKTLATTEQKIIAFAQDTMGNDWRVAQVLEVENYLKNFPGVKFVYSDGKGESALQLKNIEDFIYSKVDVLITSPRNAALMTPIISRAYQNGIATVLLSRSINGDQYSSFIHPDNRAIANKAAHFIAKKLNRKGNIFILQHIPTSTPGIHRTEGFMEAIRDYPDIEIVTMRVANSLRAEAISQTEAVLKEGVQFDAIYAQSDSMAIGAIMALKKYNIDPKSIVITGIDYISEARELIRKGEMDASYLYPTGGRQGAQIALELLAGEKVAKEIIIDSEEITRDNVEKIEPIF